MPIVEDVLTSLKQIEEIHRRKNDDYASTDNPFSNFDVAEYGLRLFPSAYDQVFVWPIFTKLARLSVLLNRNNAPNNESIEDSFIDIATYILLWKARWVERAGLKKKEDLALAIPEFPVSQQIYACELHDIINCLQCIREGRSFYSKADQ